MRGRRPKPTVLKMLSGNPGGRKLNKLEPQDLHPLGDPPAWISEDARAVWYEIVEDAPAGLFKSIDAGVLAAAACTIASCRELEVLMRGQPWTVPTGYDGSCKANPLFGMLYRERQNAMRLCVELGMTPAARSRLRLTPDPAPRNSPFQQFNPGP